METKKILMIISLIALILFSGCSNLKENCELKKGTCDYYKCKAENTNIVNHVQMYATQELACLKKEEVELIKNGNK